MKVSFKTYIRFTEKTGWLVESFDTLSEAQKCADEQTGPAWVRRVTTEIVYRNGKA